jgi:hypothetical protein
MRLLFGLLLVGALAAPAGAQVRTARFYVDSVTDSTIVFRLGRVDWLKPGTAGIAVDPRQRDALIARFRVVSVGEQRATALITGQTTFVTLDHVALVDEPPRRFWRESTFWIGTLLGGVVGGLSALAF